MMTNPIRRQRVERAGFALLAVAALLVVLPILLVIVAILVRGISAINWEFLTAMPRDGMKAGGIFPAIVGTLLLPLGTALAAIPVGVAGAIYLAEYARDTWLTRAIRLAVINLAGIPSVVYGLFGLGLFVLFLQFGTSILAGSLTLAIMTLPVIISTSEEALRAVPVEFRTVSASLGGTRWQKPRRSSSPWPPSTCRSCPPRPSIKPWRCPIISTSSSPRCPVCRPKSSTALHWCCWRWFSRSTWSPP